MRTKEDFSSRLTKIWIGCLLKFNFMEADEMRDDLRPENEFPDIELPNQDKEVVRLSSLMRGFPTAVVFSRGYY